jgi:hypothetical protein
VEFALTPFVHYLSCREFAEKNPSIAKYDAPAMLEDGHSQRLRSVAAEFAHKQVSEMQAGSYTTGSFYFRTVSSQRACTQVNQSRKHTPQLNHGYLTTVVSFMIACSHQHKWKTTL